MVFTYLFESWTNLHVSWVPFEYENVLYNNSLINKYEFLKKYIVN
jgi:hypothetical protein